MNVQIDQGDMKVNRFRLAKPDRAALDQSLNKIACFSSRNDAHARTNSFLSGFTPREQVLSTRSLAGQGGTLKPQQLLVQNTMVKRQQFFFGRRSNLKHVQSTGSKAKKYPQQTKEEMPISLAIHNTNAFGI